MPQCVGSRRWRPSKIVQRQTSPYLFDGGYEQYLSDARRLLATIRARSGEPLRARASATRWLNWGKHRFPTLAVELEDALAAPAAASPWQPSPAAIAAAPPKGSLGALIVLRPRLSPTRVLLGTLLWLWFPLLFMSACGGFFALFLYIPLSITPFLIDQPVSVTMLVILGIFTLTIVVPTFWFAIARQRSRLPIILTDDLGITKGTGRQTSTSLRWDDIRAWAILPPSPGDHDGPTYFLFTEGDSFTWREPDDAQLAERSSQGDRQLAYRQRTAELHALIAARTGLPLRELGLRKPTDMLQA